MSLYSRFSFCKFNIQTVLKVLPIILNIFFIFNFYFYYTINYNNIILYIYRYFRTNTK